MTPSTPEIGHFALALAVAFGTTDSRKGTNLQALGKLQDLVDAIGARDPADETRPNPVRPS